MLNVQVKHKRSTILFTHFSLFLKPSSMADLEEVSGVCFVDSVTVSLRCGNKHLFVINYETFLSYLRETK